jgi:hypothetical protein
VGILEHESRRLQTANRFAIAKIYAVTAEQYWAELDLISIEVNDAVQVFYTYLAMTEVAADKKLLKALSKAPLFWSTQMYCLQTTFFMILARIFDTAPDAHSVDAVLRATRNHPELFSRVALAERRRDSKLSSTVIHQFVSSAWEPTAGDLKLMEVPLKGCKQKMQTVYAPIRSKVFAHRIAKDPEREILISKAQIPEIIHILTSLQKVVRGLTELYLNGKRPEYDRMQFHDRERVKQLTQDALEKVVKGYENC